MSDIDVYPHETEVRVKLIEWGRWRAGEGVTLSGGCPQAWDELTAITAELNRRGACIPVITRNAELTDRALVELKAQSDKQHRALMHYHFRSTEFRSIARAAATHHREVPLLLRHSHDNFYVIRSQISISAAPALA